MNSRLKPSSLPQAKAKRPKIEKVSVLLPLQLKQRIAKTAKADRRALSPQIVTLVEAGLAAREVAA